MAIDVRSERLIRLADVPNIPWLSRRPKVNTVFRWVQHGLRDRRDNVVKLEFVQEGGRMCTTEAALLRFFERLAADGTEDRTPTQAKAGHDRAVAYLQSVGIG